MRHILLWMIEHIYGKNKMDMLTHSSYYWL